MIVKAMTVLLLAFVLMSLASRYIRPRVPPKPRGPAIETARKCPGCGAYMVEGGGCTTPDCPSREAA